MKAKTAPKFSDGVVSYRLGNCERCDHSPDWHRLDDAQNVGPTDPEAKFRCLGYDCEKDGPHVGGCDCPDYVPVYLDVVKVAK